MVTDFQRFSSLYTARMLEGDDTTTTTIRSYPARPDAKAFPGWQAFGFWQWEPAELEPVQGPQVVRGPSVWRPNAYPKGPGDHYHGPHEWFEYGIPPDQLGHGDPDRRCGVPTIEMDGGAEAGQTCVVYSVAGTAPPVGDCVPCNQVVEGVADIDEVDVADYTDGTHVYIPNLITGAVGHWVALTIAGSRGWIDLCTCTESWWCVNGDCVPSAGPPENYTAGPYISQACCVDACVGVRCCNDPAQPAFPTEGELLHMVHELGPCPCLDGVEGAGNSPAGDTIVGSWTGACGDGMLAFNATVYCDEPERGQHGWKMAWDSASGENPACTASGIAEVTIDDGHPFSCNPVNMWFLIDNFPGLCCSGDDQPEQVWAHWTGPPVLMAARSGPGASTPAIAGSSSTSSTRSLTLTSSTRSPASAGGSSTSSTSSTRSAAGAGGRRAAGTPRRTLPCVHQGGPTRQLVPCVGCSRGAALKLHGCAVHGECTVDLDPRRHAVGVAACGTCPDYEAAGG